MLDKYWWINYRMNEWWKAIPSREPEVYVWLGFLPNLQLVFPVGTDDTPRSIFISQVLRLSRWTILISYGSLKSSQVLFGHWGQVAELIWDGAAMNGFWPGLRRSAFLTGSMASQCLLKNHWRNAVLLRLQSVLVYKSKNSFFPQWIRKGQKSFEKPPTRYWHCFLFISYSKIGDHNCHLYNIWSKRKNVPASRFHL